MNKIIIDPEFKSLIPPLTEEEYTQLEKNILEDGCRDPLVTWDGILIDGHNRAKIIKEHKIDQFEFKEMFFESRGKAKEWIILNQFGRRNISAYSRSELALKLEETYKDQAEKNLKMPTGGKNRTTLSTLTKSNTREKIAEIAKVSTGNISKVKTIQEKATPEQKDKLRTGEETINKIYIEIKREEKEEKREAKRQQNQKKISNSKNINSLDGVFQTIVIDPPWDWSDEGDKDQLGRAKPDYFTMTIDQLLELPVEKFSDKDCHLYLWITNRSLPKGFKLIEQWGFRYITCLTWVKPSFGMGNYFRGSTEQVLFAVKGSQPLKRKDVGTHFFADRGSSKHSSKPEEFFSIVESCSYGPYLEMFGRNSRENWTIWGEDS